MKEVRRSALVPQSAAQMYGLVNDIERYPEFLPWCSAARVDARSETEARGTLEVGRAGVKLKVSTANRMEPGRRIDLVQSGGPLKALSGCWRFTPIERDGVEQGSRVELEVHFEFLNGALTLLFAPLFEHTWDSVVEAFVRRAREQYPGGAAAAGPRP